ncbi:hypothetical protein [Streptomyces sp. NPDC059411]|uniref:hypothetical protein n=1 Tax=Streptomyces sp. NPDC059411 TaxID=3346825 RepID=UPI0036BA4BA9
MVVASAAETGRSMRRRSSHGVAGTGVWAGSHGAATHPSRAAAPAAVMTSAPVRAARGVVVVHRRGCPPCRSQAPTRNATTAEVPAMEVQAATARSCCPVTMPAVPAISAGAA